MQKISNFYLHIVIVAILSALPQGSSSDCLGAHYELSFGCPRFGYGYLVGYGPVLQEARSAVNPSVTSFSQCLEHCDQKRWCDRTAWFSDSGACYLYNYIDYGTDDLSCMMSIKICTGAKQHEEKPKMLSYASHYGNFAKNPSIPEEKLIARKQEHEEGNALKYEHTLGPNKPIYNGDNQPNKDLCSDTDFERLPYTSGHQGYVLQGKFTMTECAAVCNQEHLQCAGFTYNNLNGDCVLHNNELQTQNVVRGERPCCDFFRRKTCSKKLCYNGTGESTVNLKPITCDGICFMEYGEIRDNSSTVIRGCDVSKATTKTEHCYAEPQIDSNGDLTSVVERCICETSFCNSFPVTLFKEMVLHLNLDRHTGDSSPKHRHGTPHNLLYDDVESFAGSAAHFSGTSYIAISSLENTLLFTYKGGDKSCFSLSLWFKSQPSRQDGTEMFIAGNNIMELSVTTYESENRQLVECVITSNDKHQKTLKALVTLDTWINVAIISEQDRQLAETNVVMLTYEMDTDVTTTDSASLSATFFVSNEPFVIGRRFSHNNHFIGHVDEVYMFHHCLTRSDLQIMQHQNEEIHDSESRDKEPGQDNMNGSGELEPDLRG